MIAPAFHPSTKILRRVNTFDAVETRRHYPSIPVTTLEEVVRNQQAARAVGEPEVDASGGRPRPAVV